MENNFHAVLAKIAESNKSVLNNETGDDLLPVYDYDDDEEIKIFLKKHFPAPEKLMEEHLSEEVKSETVEAPRKRRPTKYSIFIKKVLTIVEEERSTHFDFLRDFDELINIDVLLYYLKFCPCAAKKFKKLTQNDNIVVFDHHVKFEKNAKAFNLIMKYILRMEMPPSFSNTLPSTEKVMYFLDAVPIKKPSLWSKISKRASMIFCTKQTVRENSTEHAQTGMRRTKCDYFISKTRVIIPNDLTIISDTPEGVYKKIVIFLYDRKFTKTMSKTNKMFLRLSKMDKLFVWHFNVAKNKYQHFFLVNVEEKSSGRPTATKTDKFVVMLTIAIFITIMIVTIIH